MDSLRVGIVGCGKIADAHVESLARVPTGRLVAACDAEPLMAEQLAVRYGIPRYYSDLHRMLETERLDVLHIATPPDSHLAIATQALESGCHLFVEKPLALNHTESTCLLDRAAAAGRKVTINYWPNFDPSALALWRIFDEGVLGEAVHVESFLGYDLSGSFGRAFLADPAHWVHRLPGKLFHNILDHVLNRVVRFLPDEDPHVHAVGYRRRPPAHNRVTDSVLDELRFLVCGQQASACGILCSHVRPVANYLRVSCTRNTAHLDYANRTLVLEPDPKLPGVFGRLAAPFSQAWSWTHQGARNVLRFSRSEFHYFAGMTRLLSLFFESILHDSAPPIPYHEILWVAAMMDVICSQVYQDDSRHRRGRLLGCRSNTEAPRERQHEPAVLSQAR